MDVRIFPLSPTKQDMADVDVLGNRGASFQSIHLSFPRLFSFLILLLVAVDNAGEQSFVQPFAAFRTIVYKEVCRGQPATFPRVRSQMSLDLCVVLAEPCPRLVPWYLGTVISCLTWPQFPPFTHGSYILLERMAVWVG